MNATFLFPPSFYRGTASPAAGLANHEILRENASFTVFSTDFVIARAKLSPERVAREVRADPRKSRRDKARALGRHNSTRVFWSGYS